MKKDKILYYIGLIAVSVGLACAIAAVIFDLTNYAMVSNVLFVISSILGIGSFVVLFIRLRLQAKDFGFNSNNPPKVVVKVVDVKDIKKTREQELYEQYENLYKQNLITKEDLDKKKQELLGKK